MTAGDFFVHESAYVDEPVSIGMGTKIWHFSHVMSGAQIGEECIIGQNVYIGRDVKVGRNVKIQNNVSVYEMVTLEDDVFCGPSMVFTNVLNPRSHVPRKDEFKPTLVKRGASLGANCTIICGVTVGRFAMVGAGATVSKDVPDYAFVVGSPARRVGWMCACGVRLAFEGERAECEVCGDAFVKEAEAVLPASGVESPRRRVS